MSVCVRVCEWATCVQVQVVHLWRPQIFCQHVCVLEGRSVDMNHFCVIGTENVIRMMNRLPDYAEYLLSDSNMGKKKKIILRVPVALEILISSRLCSLLF